jgi:hypothetical protein
MLPPTPMLLAAAPGSTATVILAPRWAPHRVPRKGRALRQARTRAAAAIGGEFGGLGRRRAVAGEFIERLRNVLPGGSWWRLEDGDGGGRAEGSGTTAVSALGRMWSIVAADRWVVYAGFVSLVGAAVMRAVMWLTSQFGYFLLFVDDGSGAGVVAGCSLQRSLYPIYLRHPFSPRRMEGPCSTEMPSF